MAVIDPIYNGEGGASVRAKLNELIDTVNSGSQTINVGDAPLYDPLKAGGYEAGSIISYKNESSPNPEFQEFAIYLALDDIPQGVGPEDSPNWKNEGATMEIAGGNTANGVVQNIDRLRELTGMRTGHTVAVQAEGAIYVFDEGSESGIKPFAPGIGSWVKRYEFSEMGGGHAFEDSTDTVLPTRSVAKAGAGIEFEDDAVNEMTVVRVDENLTDHVDGADEVKHTFNQIAIAENKVLLGGEAGQGIEGDTVDVYAISAAHKAFLETESNWIVSGEPVANINAGFGLQGNRYSTVNWSYECYADGFWLRTPTGVAYLDVYNAVTAEAILLIENTANWTSKAYTGTAITGVKKGARHYNNDYLFEFVDDNLPIRVSRV
jgi:hypothetical protein